MIFQKRSRFFCFTLALLLILNLFPLAAAAVGVTQASNPQDTLPTVLPDGKDIDHSKLWVNWADAGVDGAAIENGFNKATAGNRQAWTHKGVTTLSWKGASGLMFYVDASGIGDKNVDFVAEMLLEQVRPRSATAVGCVQLKTHSSVWRPAGDGGPINGKESSHAYYFKDGSWNHFQLNAPGYYLDAGVNYSGWYYLPLDSFFYHGGSGTGYDLFDSKEPTGILNFHQFMDRYENQKIWKISLKTNQVGLKFGDVHFVYADPEPSPEYAASSPLFSNMALNGNPEGSAKGTVKNNAVTVTGMAQNSATASGSRIWLKGFDTNALKKADGIRFHVDTTAMGADARLQLRLRMRAGVATKEIKDVYSAGKEGGYASIQGGMPQYILTGDGAVAYYFETDGTPKVLRVQTPYQANGDLFEALPQGYNGDVYIPFESYWMSTNSYVAPECAIPYRKAIEKYPVDLINICSAVTGTEGGGVTYSNFELVYNSAAITGASVSLAHDLNVNFYASLPESATNMTVDFVVGSRSETVAGAKQKDGSYRFTCKGLLPQTVGDTVYATLHASLGGTNVTTKTVAYSVREYCEHKLACPDSSKELKNLLVDLLYYGEAAQNYADYRVEDLATKNLTAEQKALRRADATASITATPSLSGTADANYKWVSAALRLENALAVKFRFSAASLEGLTAEITVNGRTVTVDHFEGQNGSYTVVFEGIGAAEYNSEIKAVLKKNGTQIGETLTYSVAAYIGEAVKKPANNELKDLLRSIYSYGVSAEEYLAKGQV